MKDFLQEILAYSLQNAVEFGKADAARVLPKLFQHGLKKTEIKEIMPLIKEAVKKVNSMSEKKRLETFEKYKDLVKVREHEEKGLEELPGSESGKKLVFRLAPFPSGALHLGNAKTYILNALYAEKYNGEVILVMDDTIGSSEKPAIKEGYKLIEDAFSYLRIKYKKPVYYKSKRLSVYYRYAEKLISKGKAYVCHCKQDEMRENRAKGVECGCRHFPSGIQKLRWREMFNMDEGHAVLRLKTDMQHKNPAFRDRVLFKISEREHPRVGKKYRVWPSLEMSWSVDDHLLGVTHIIRGNDLMMETMMEKYIWDIFKWKHPEVIHTGLIKIEGIEGSKVSKSKAQKEVLSGEFIGWDDPRTWSIQSLASRGITTEAIRGFVEEIGLNKQDITVPIENLYAWNRRILDEKANRYSFVEKPKKISIENVLNAKEIEIPLNPNNLSETKKVSVGNTLYVSEKDFSQYRKEEVRFLHLFNATLKEETKASSVENKRIPKVNWVSEGVKTKILMPNVKWISGLAESNIENLEVGDIIQFERFGFCRYAGQENGIHEFWFGHK